MRIIQRRKTRWWLWSLILILLAACYVAWATQRPLLDIAPMTKNANLQAKVPVSFRLFFPTDGQAAVGIAGSSILQTHGTQTSVPTASTAKLITALAVLRQKPLTIGQQGPAITLTGADIALFNYYNGRQGSVVPVQAGEQITEYQMLQAIMLPSANNIADSLAVWAFSSLPNYASYANGYIAKLGLNATHVGSDASGFDPSTVSSAHDLVRLGELAMQNPVLAQIVGQKTAVLPVAGMVKNVNYLLGTDGIIGVKTGNTDQAGGVFIGASSGIFSAKPITMVTAVTGSPDLPTAMKESLSLMQATQKYFGGVSIVETGTVVGRYQLPWGGSIPAVAAKYIRSGGWGGSTIPYTVHLKPLPANAVKGYDVGRITVPESKSALNRAASTDIYLGGTPTAPSFWWRLTHPLQ